MFFCDLVGSTEPSARLDPEDLREIVRACLGAAVGAVERFAATSRSTWATASSPTSANPQAHDDAERAHDLIAIEVGVT